MSVETREYQWKNFARSLLAAGLTAADTSLTVTTDEGTKFPTLAAGQIFSVVLAASGSISPFEIIYVTAVSGDTLTIERGKEDTTAKAWSVGTAVVHTLTKGFFESRAGVPPTTPVLSLEVIDDDSIELTWTASIAGVAIATVIGYDVYQSIDGGAYSLLTGIDAADPLVLDIDYLTGATTYDYYVIAVTDIGPDSAASNIVDTTTPTPPAAETFIVVSQNLKKALTSADGDVWTLSSGSYATAVTTTAGIAYSPTLGRALLTTIQNNTPDVATSDDGGDTWSAYAGFNGSNEWRARWAFGKFFVSQSDGIKSSSTGLNSSWSSAVTGQAACKALGYSEGEARLVAIFSNPPASPTLKYTDDGASFSSGSVSGLSTTATALAVERDDEAGIWYCLFDSGAIYKTTDVAAGTWSAVAGTAGSTTDPVGSIAFKPGGTMVVASGGTSGVYSSVDAGATFVQHASGDTIYEAIWSDYLGLFIAVGFTVGSASLIYTSPDGLTWTAAGTVPANGLLAAITKVVAP